MRKWYLVSYDVRDEKRLRKTAKLLEGYGQRVQFSVFRCLLSDRQVERLRWELAQRMEPSDSLLIIGLCSACVNSIRKKNLPQDWPEEPEGWLVV